MFGEGSKLTKNVKGYDANSSYLDYSGDVMHCGKDTLVVNEKTFDQKRIVKFLKNVLKGKVLGFVQVDVELYGELYDKFSETVLLFLVQEIPDCNIPEEMKMCKEKTCRKTDQGTKKLVSVVNVRKILLYKPMICWFCKMVWALK